MLYESIMESMENYCRKAAWRWLKQHNFKITEEVFEEALQAARIGVWRHAQEVKAEKAEDLLRGNTPYWKVFHEIFGTVVREGCEFGGIKYRTDMPAEDRPEVSSLERTQQDVFGTEWNEAELSRLNVDVFYETLPEKDRIILRKLMRGNRVCDILEQTGIERAEYYRARKRIGRAWKKYMCR